MKKFFTIMVAAFAAVSAFAQVEQHYGKVSR